MSVLNQRQIPTFLVSGIFRPNHFFFSWFGKQHRQCLNFFNHLFLQNKESENGLYQAGFTHTSVVGDTRLDRVLAIATENKRFELIDKFAEADNRPIIVCGSTWQPDEAIISQYINENSDQLPFRFIIAPHEIKAFKVNDLIQKINIKTIRYSAANINNISGFDVLIIDNIGMLSALYRYGKIAYIGGAFGSGLHNILEPIVFGLPVIFGEKYQKFEEAVTLVNQQGSFSISNYQDFETIINQLLTETFYQQSASTAMKYITDNQGATQKIIQAKQVKL